MTAPRDLQAIVSTVDVKPLWCRTIRLALGEGRYIAEDTDGALWLCRIEMVRREFLNPGPIGLGQRPYASVLMPVFGPVTEPLVIGPYAAMFDPFLERRAA